MGFNLTVTVGKVDMHGFLGRENHPAESDNGAVGRVVRVTPLDADSFAVIDDDYEVAAAPGQSVPMFTVVFEGGRLVDLLEHEIESVNVWAVRR
jgi:hypothetical protein